MGEEASRGAGNEDGSPVLPRSNMAERAAGPEKTGRSCSPTRTDDEATASTSEKEDRRHYLASNVPFFDSVNSVPPQITHNVQNPHPRSDYRPNIIQLPKFTNSLHTAGQWWSLFVQWFTYFGMTETAAIQAFPFQLGPQVLQWFLTIAEDQKSTLNALKRTFFKRFSPDSTFDVAILNIKQFTEESVEDYFARLHGRIFDAKIPERLAVGIALQGLRSQLAHIVMPQNPQTMDQVRTKALLAEKTIKATSTPNDSLHATLSSMEERLMSNLSAKLESTLSAITVANENKEFRPYATRTYQNSFTNNPNTTRDRQYRNSTQYFGNQRQQNPTYRYPNTERQFNPKDPRQFQFRTPNPQIHNQPTQGCPGCGRFCTSRRACPAFGRTCFLCSRPNHFQSVCRSGTGRNVNHPQ